MKGFELVKREDHWALYNEDGHKIAATIPGCNSKLSLKNCQAIENGYDLDELLDCLLINRGEHFSRVRNPLYGEERQLAKDLVQKALEILGDKKFSKDDLALAYSSGWVQRHNEEGSYYGMQKELIQSLQQTEWDVEVMMEEAQEIYRSGVTKYIKVPKLDADDCLILKRI